MTIWCSIIPFNSIFDNSNFQIKPRDYSQMLLCISVFSTSPCWLAARKPFIADLDIIRFYMLMGYEVIRQFRTLHTPPYTSTRGRYTVKPTKFPQRMEIPPASGLKLLYSPWLWNERLLEDEKNSNEMNWPWNHHDHGIQSE